MITSLAEVLEALENSPSRASGGARRVLVGIAGEPGAGKSTLAGELVASLPSAVLLPMDGFHLPQARLEELGRRDRMGAPDTFDVDGFVATLSAVKNSGRTVLAPDFDRGIEESVADRIAILPELSTVVVEGNYLLHWPEVRALLDLTFFVDIDHDLRLERLIARHVRYGKTPDAAASWARGPDERNALVVRESAALADYTVRLD